MRKEREGWESDSMILAEEEAKNAPSANAPGPGQVGGGGGLEGNKGGLVGKTSDDSTLRGGDEQAAKVAEDISGEREVVRGEGHPDGDGMNKKEEHREGETVSEGSGSTAVA